MKHINLKSIFATFLLLVGVCQVSYGWNWTNNSTLYFDNSKTKWEEVYVIIGHDNDNGYSRAYQMTKRPNSTLYELTISFDNYDRFFISSTTGDVSTEVDGNHPKITTAETACSLRTQSIHQSVESDILIEVSGTNSPYAITDKANFNLDDYALVTSLPEPKTASNLILFNTNPATLGAWLWGSNNQGIRKHTTTISKFGDMTLSYIDNSTTNYIGAIAFSVAGTDNSTNWNDDKGTGKISGDITSKENTTYINRYYRSESSTTNNTTFSSFTHISTTFSVKADDSDVTQAAPNTPLTLEATETDGTLFTDGGNSAKYAFYVKTADGTITRLQSFSTTTSTNYTTPTTPQTITLYCYVQDVYGLETIQYTQSLEITGTPNYTVKFDANGRGNAKNMPGAQKIEKDQSATKPAAPTAEGYTFGGWYTEAACTTAYDFTTPVTADITLYAKWTETKEIYVQGRFRVRKSEGGEFLYTGEKGYDDWNENSKSIQFIYDSETKLYKLPTYCTTWELSKSDNQDGAVFHFKIGEEHWGATDNTNPQPGYNRDNGKEIQATQNNFKFTYACTNGKNVVLWLDLENKKLWYEVEDSIPPLYALDGDDDFRVPTYLTPDADYTTAKCTVTCTSRGLKRFNLRQVVSGDDLTSIGAIKCAQGTIMRRSICEKITFLEEGNSAGANPAIVVDTKGKYIFTYTYATNELTVTYPEKVVTPQEYILYGDFDGTEWKEYDGTWTNNTKTGTWILENIPEGAHMFMLKAADGNLYFNAAAGAGSIQRENTTVKVDNEYSSEYRENITLNADEAGTYTFTLDFDNRLITVKYPNSDKIKVKYRLVYAEQKPDGKYEKYHPSTPYIDALAEGATEVRRDTVSLHIRDSVPVYDYNSLNQTEKILHYDYNPNTLSVHLQKWTGKKWEEISTVSLSGEQRKGKVGVYNFVVVQAPNAEKENRKVYIDEKIEAYKGNYYIRTNVAPGGWNNYKKSENQITYSDYAAQHKHFDHYWCKWIEPSKPVGYYVRDGMANLKFTIANDYSNCVSDTCRDELDNRKFTINGRLGSSANVRWMWHSKTNAADRAYIAGGDNCLFFVPKSEGIICKDKDGKPTNETCAFTDRQNWTYKIDVTTPPNTKFAITKKPHGDAGDTRYCILGCETEEGETLILGTGIHTYDMRVVYDFKSDHLIYAWIPADPTINDPIVLGGTVVCMRKDDGEATQVTFGEKGALNDVHEALGVLSLSKTYFWTDWTKNNKWEREWYWISFPFDVCVSDIFSSFVFGQHYIIQDYDGASRAEKGCWANSSSYWRTLTRSDTLKAGKGYVLNIGHDEVENIGSNPYLVDKEITELNIYFPSTGVTEITGAIQSVDVPKHPCSITDHDRNIYDSNWNLIGVPTWVNIEGMEDGSEPEQPNYKDVSNIIINEGKTVGFYYHFNTGAENGNTWTPRNVKDVNDKLVFKNMRSYLIQWAGTINWSNRSWDDNPSTQGLQARRAAEAKSEEYTLRLELSRGETALDQTFVRLQEDGDVTADYDMNYDMTKIINPGANLYSLIGTNLIQAGANVQPLPAENTTVYVPMGVVADKDGMYRFSMPDGTDGMLVSIADHETGTVHNLATGYCDVPLTKGTYEQRFVLEIQPKKNVTTGCNESTTDDGTLRKVLIDGNLYIQRGDALYDAAGRAL